MAARWLNGDLLMIAGFIVIRRRSTGAPTVTGRPPDDHRRDIGWKFGHFLRNRTVAEQSPDGGRQAPAGWLYNLVRGQENWPVSCRSRKIGIGEKSMDHRLIYKACDIGCKNTVLFLRNWIRSGVRKVGDLIFTNGVLDERSMYQRIMCKRNIHCEIMLVKKALSPYQQSLRVANNGALCTEKPMRSKDFYNIFRSQIIDNANFLRISNYLAAYCESDEEISAFSRIVSHEKEIKFKEFNFKVLHGILPCNRNLMRWTKNKVWWQLWCLWRSPKYWTSFI